MEVSRISGKSPKDRLQWAKVAFLKHFRARLMVRSILAGLMVPLVLSFLLVLSQVMAFAQAPEVEWQKTFGGSGHDIGSSVKQTLDGGYIIAGWTESFGEGMSDIYLLKTDASGELIWQRTFGGSGEDNAQAVQNTSDGGYIIVGHTFSFGSGDPDVYLLRTDTFGQLIWQRTFGGSGWDWGYSVQQTSDGGYIIVGWTDSFGAGEGDVYLIKTDPSGNLVWQRTFGGSKFDSGSSVQQTSDGGYIIVGWTQSFGAGSSDIYLLKTDASGQLIWQTTFGGSSGEVGFSIQQTSDGGYIILGYTLSFGQGGYDVYLVKTNSTGSLIWQKSFGGSGDEGGASVCRTADGGYIVAGWTDSFGAGEGDVYLIKTDPSGNLVWQRTFGGSKVDTGNFVQQTTDGGYIIAGWTSSFGAGETDVYLTKLGPEGPAEDILPPSLIQDFNASDGENGQSTLCWTNPSDDDLAQVIVRRKTDGYPSDHTNGDLVYQDTSPTPGALG